MEALFPHEFSEGPNGMRSGYEVLDETYSDDPRRLLTPLDRAMVPLWDAFREKVMPEPGGYLDQAAINVSAFGFMSAAATALRQKYRGHGAAA